VTRVDDRQHTFDLGRFRPDHGRDRPISFGDVPTYVYKFVETGETIEVQQSFDDPTLTETTHPVTGATMAVKKVFQPVGVTFRGTGFYKTDSRSSSSAPGKSTTTASSDGAKSESSTSTTSPSTTPASTSSTKSD
jgi:predicted nucleic acid-binding Zn ribbon protein